MPSLDVYVCLCKRSDETVERHWLIMTKEPNSSRGTWYHSTGGPTRNTDYEVEIQANKRADSQGIESSYHVGTISSSDAKKFKAAAQAVPAQQCQLYVVAVLYKLEAKGFVNPGTYEYWESRVEPSRRNAAASASGSRYSGNRSVRHW